MKKTAFKILSLLLALAFLLFIAGCGEKNPIIGKWETKISHNTLTANDVAAKIGVWEYINFDNVYKAQTYEFTEDGYYTVSSDNEQYIADYTKAVEDGLYAYYDTIIKENNLKITVEEAMEIDEVTVDDLVDKASLEALRNEARLEGKYKTEDGKLYLSAGKEYEVDENIYIEYEITEEGVLRLKKQVGGDIASNTTYYPLDLTKSEK